MDQKNPAAEAAQDPNQDETGPEAPPEPINEEETAEARQARREQEAAERAEFPPQKIRIRAEPGSTGLVLVVQRFDSGEEEAGEMQPRTTYERELRAGDRLHVVTLHEWQRTIGNEPKREEGGE